MTAQPGPVHTATRGKEYIEQVLRSQIAASLSVGETEIEAGPKGSTERVAVAVLAASVAVRVADVALATVVGTWGSSPCQAGSHLAVSDDSAFVGSVSGGCIEGAVVTEALQVIADGRPRQLEYGVTDEMAWAIGLACGGKVRIYVERVE